MKKTIGLLLALFLVACGSGEVIKSEGKSEFVDRNGEKQVVNASVEVKDEKIVSISIDETYTVNGKKTTKKTLGDEYGMKGESTKGEWYEQINHLEKQLIGTDGDIELDEKGIAKDSDVLSGCTIVLTNIEDAVEDAMDRTK